MKDSLQYIDSYFKGEFSSDELKLFENRIMEDPAFAEELAFYVTSIQALRHQLTEDKKGHFREIYKEKAIERNNAPVKKLWPYLSAAAAVAAIALGFFLFYPVSAPPKLADNYLKEHLSTFGVMMNSEADSMQTGIMLYNKGQLQEALSHFEKILQSHPSDNKAKEYAGIVSLRLMNYDEALKYFRELEVAKGLYANPGKFYVSLTLMKRNLPGDVQEAKMLLQQVVKQGLQYDRDAKELLKKL